jgi:uncharacterized membrane protein
MGHAHHAPAEADPSRRTRRALSATAVVLALAAAVGLVALWPHQDPRHRAIRLGLASRVDAAVVVRARHGPCTGASATPGGPGPTCLQVRFRLTEGPNRGQTRDQEFPAAASTPDLKVGDKVVLDYVPHADRGFDYQFADRQRRAPLLWLAVLFGLAVVALGRWRGLAALVGLGASLAVLLAFILPALLDGRSPVLVAIVGSAVIAYVALYLANGVRTMTTVALLGTLATLAAVVGLAELFTSLARFSGFATEEALLVRIGTTGVDLKGLILAGMVLGALGALNDITVTQASAVWELRAADPAMPRLELFRAGMRIGRDHVASTVNTLALAYAGAALPVLILFVLSKQSLGTVANSEVVATEIVRTLVGSIGLVAAVPLTTWLAAEVAAAPRGDSRRSRRPRPTGVEPPAVEPALAPDPVTPSVPAEEFWRRR